jgi:hypothetical protein
MSVAPTYVVNRTWVARMDPGGGPSPKLTSADSHK